MEEEVLVKVENISKKFCKSLKRSLWYGMHDIAHEFTGHKGDDQLRKDEFWALKDISFELKRGECLGLIGHNGAGKSTLLKMLNGLIKPDKGKITMKGRVCALIELGAGFNPILTGRENIYINASVLGLTKKEIDAKFDAIVDFAEIREFIDTPVQNYSSGMRVRLGFAVAAQMEPDVLLIDEVLTVGDAQFKMKGFEKIGELLTSAAVVFVSHDEAQISRICNHGLLLNKGHKQYLGNTDEALDLYKSNYLFSPKKSILIKEPIDDVKIQPLSEEIEYGGMLPIKIDIFSKHDIEVGLCLITINDFTGFCTQTDITKDFKNINKGFQSISIVLGPLNLRKNDYTASLTLLDKTKKRTIIHILNIFTFNMVGKLGYGVTYQVPYKVSS